MSALYSWGGKAMRQGSGRIHHLPITVSVQRQGWEFSHHSSYGSKLVKCEDRCTLAIVCPCPSSCWLARIWGGGTAEGDTSISFLPHSVLHPVLVPYPHAAPSPCPLSSWGLRYNPGEEGRKRETGRIMPLRTLHLKPVSAHGLLLTLSSFTVT